MANEKLKIIKLSVKLFIKRKKITDEFLFFAAKDDEHKAQNALEQTGVIFWFIKNLKHIITVQKCF